MSPKDFKVKGFLFSGISAGIKKDGRKDLALVFSEVPAQVAGLFTTNQVQAAPVVLDRERLRGGCCQALVVNSGNANACTGERGLRDVKKVTSWVAKGLGIKESLVFASSTGVIGVPLPMQKIEKAIPRLIGALSPEGWMDTVEAIMTTDTIRKMERAKCEIKGRPVKICGMAKGAGMIRPNLATMLSFIVTDANVKASLLQRMLEEVVMDSYGRITVDGETSTNDTVLLLANGTSGHPQMMRMDRDGARFQRKLLEVCQNLAKSIVKDGEGATKMVEIYVKGAKTQEDAKRAAYAIAHSPLVKTAFFGMDANWGRILCAVGHSGARIDPNRVDLFFDTMPVVRDGIGVGRKMEEKAARVLRKRSFRVTVDLRCGKGEFSVFTSDLSIDYVKINASYRS